MANVVFILGAGASKQAGVPLMLEFLDVAHNLWKSNRVEMAKESFETVFNGIAALQSVHSKSVLDIQNVESVFTAFEMAKIFGRFPTCTVDDIDKLISAMKTVIVHTIEQTLEIPIRGGEIDLPAPYGRFTSLIRELTKEARPKESVAIITFNYDVAVDYAFNRMGISFNYCLEDEQVSNTIIVPLLKLHGSLNWARCQNCGNVVIQPMPTESRTTFREDRKIILHVSSKKGLKHCNLPVLPDPVIVPPTWNKTDYQASLSNVWVRAAQELSEAENIFVIGYSLPPTDAFFEYLYALGSVGDVTLKKSWVFNPDDTGNVKQRFESLLGPGAHQRFKYFPMTFDKAIDQVRNQFRFRD
jgi:NAD-dependent SIR2 family protein deacetylase